MRVAVVGGGPAGSSAAVAALQNQHEVVLWERNPGGNKPCGDAVGSGAVQTLERLGLSHVLVGAQQVDDVELTGPGGLSSVARPGESAFVLPRRVLDAALLAAAADRGAVIHHHSPNLQQDGDAVVVDGEKYDVVIAADGAFSAVRGLLEGRVRPGRGWLYAVRGFVSSAAGHAMQLRWVKHGWPAYAWAFEEPGGMWNVGWGCEARQAQKLETLKPVEACTAAWPDAPLAWTEVKGWRSAWLPTTAARLPLSHGRNVLFTGDAAGLINPLSGEGVGSALLSGRLAGSAAGSESPADAYRKALSQISAWRRQVGVIAVTQRFVPFFVDRAVNTVGADTSLAAQVCGAALGTQPVAYRNLPRLIF